MHIARFLNVFFSSEEYQIKDGKRFVYKGPTLQVCALLFQGKNYYLVVMKSASGTRNPDGGYPADFRDVTDGLEHLTNLCPPSPIPRD